MKNLKKFASLLLALVMAMALAVPAFATDGGYTITINNDKEGHTYEAYQIFTGDLAFKVNGKIQTTQPTSGDYEIVLSNIEWGSNVSEAGKTALRTCVEVPDNASAADVAAKLTSGFDTEQAQAFAKIAGSNTTGTSLTSNGPKDGKYTISVPTAGYYLIMDKADTLNEEDDAYTRYILQVVADQTVTPKSETPSIDKKIVDGDGDYGTSAGVGDVVKFEVTSTVPDTTGYDTYKYIVSDTMTSGLTFNNDIKVTIDGTEVTSPVYTVKTENIEETFVITFSNLVDYTKQKIVITYSATVNDAALLTNVETNTVGLQYSNNPNKDDDLGKTPEKTVYVYDFDIEIDKFVGGTDNDDTATRLSGAKFVLRKKDTTEYYSWNETDKKVEWKAINSDSSWKEAEWSNAGATVRVTEDGKVGFEGLAAGKYELVEIEAPAGYNLLPGPVDVEITIEYNEDGTLKTSNATVGEAQPVLPVPVANNSGAQLPSTGGIGTTIFYVVGGVLAAGAVILLITKRRMSIEK